MTNPMDSPVRLTACGVLVSTCYLIGCTTFSHPDSESRAVFRLSLLTGPLAVPFWVKKRRLWRTCVAAVIGSCQLSLV